MEAVNDNNELAQILKEAEKTKESLEDDLKGNTDIGKSFEKKRRKLADAKIRKVANKRREELE